MWTKSSNKHQQRRVWVVRWIVEGSTIRQVAAQSGDSPRTLRRLIAYWLDRPPARRPDCSASRYLLFDGTMLAHRKGVCAVMDAGRFAVVAAAPEMAEPPAPLQPFCATLAQHGFAPLSATVDGNPHVLRLVRRLWPTIRIQRGLVPMQRQGLSGCRRQPKRRDAQHLRALLRQIMAIHPVADREPFVAQVQSWEQRYGARLAGAAETGWVVSDLKRARSLVLAALPDMFHSLDDPAIPKSTNALEGSFARLKHKYRPHRGLAPAHRSAYFRWYVHLCPR